MLYRWVFNCFLKVPIVVHSVTDDGRLFQATIDEQRNARSEVFSLVDGTSNMSNEHFDDDRSAMFLIGLCSGRRDAKYDGKPDSRSLYTIVASLKVTRAFTGNQCSFWCNVPGRR